MPDCPCPLREAARDWPGGIALVFEGAPFTFAQLDQEAQITASQLQQLGIGRGDRIATLLPPSPPLIALFFAAWRCGASICPLSPRNPPSQILQLLERLSPKLFIDGFPIHTHIRPSETSLSQALFLFTSGSTATPKIAVLSLKSLLASASSHSVVDLTPQDRWGLSLPLFHVGGIGILLRCILARATLSLDKEDPLITHLSCVPTQLYRPFPPYKKLKCLLLGGAPIRSYPTTLPIWGTYGLTEMGSWVVARKHPPKINGTYALGLPLPGREISISPSQEILVRGETLFQGYWEKGELSPYGEWFQTGDIGTLDPKEGLQILGRKDWQFISGGENIQPEEIEQTLLQIPEILEAVVVPKEDPEFGHRPVAFVRASTPSFSYLQMEIFLRDRLPKYKIPIALFLLDDLPKKGLKIDRKQLLEKVQFKSDF